MKLYYFDGNGMLSGVKDAKFDPKEGRPLQPRGTTFSQPPDVKDGQVVVFVGNEFKEGHWQIKADYRGTYWNTETRQKVIISQLGVPPSPELTTDEPGEYDYWDGSGWKFNHSVYKDILRDRYVGKCKTKIFNSVLDDVPYTKEDALRDIAVFDEVISKIERKEDLDEYVLRDNVNGVV
jgi:hypothetical protein